jgi:transposase InsO family protein
MERPMDQKVKLIGDWLNEHYSITDLSKKYGVSRKTIYKWLERYNEEGISGLEDKSRASHTHPNKTDNNIVDQIIEYKLKHRTWGPKKIVTNLKRIYPKEKWPSVSTTGDLLKKNDLVNEKKIRKHVHQYQDHFVDCTKPNDVWSADYKGQFYTKDKKVCYPLTVTDNFSRFLIACDALEGPRYNETRACFERIFREYGLPLAIRTDNGTPFSGMAVGGLSRLSIWWIQLGIIPERIIPGKPQQNGRHERMHRTLKCDTLNPVEFNLADQQKKFDFFRVEYNIERPHESIGMKRPGELFEKSNRSYPDIIKPIEYPDDFQVRNVKHSGEISFGNSLYFISELLYRDKVGLKEIEDGLWQMNYGFHKLGYIDLERKKILRYLKKV